MNDIIYLTRVGAQNVGDATLQKNVQRCLVREGFKVTTVALKDAATWQTFTQRDIVVSAGGFCCNYHTRPGEFVIYEYLLARNNRLYFWGPGFNEHAQNVYFPDYGAPYSMHYDEVFRHPNVVMVGFRDYGNPFEYIPCPSCLDPGFDEPCQDSEEVIILEHEILELNLPGGESYPKKKQALQRFTFEEVVHFLGGAGTVVTNTYHGAYWATLLNKKVVVYKPWSSKFHTLKYTPTFANEINYREAIASATNHSPNFLAEARSLNEDFIARLRERLAPAG